MVGSSQADWRERLQWTGPTHERGPQPVCRTEARIRIADGILYGGSKGSRIVDERASTTDRDALPGTLRSAVEGLMALREVELNETHRLVFEPESTHPCSVSNCPSHTPIIPTALEAYRKVFDHILGSFKLRTNVLQVPESYDDCGGNLQCAGPGICSGCVGRWETGHAELRKSVWAKLPDVFGLKS